MRQPRWKLSKEDLVRYALEGVRMLQGVSAGSPFLTDEESEEWSRVERELRRRLKIFKSQEVKE